MLLDGYVCKKLSYGRALRIALAAGYYPISGGYGVRRLLRNAKLEFWMIEVAPHSRSLRTIVRLLGVAAQAYHLFLS